MGKPMWGHQQQQPSLLTPPFLCSAFSFLPNALLPTLSSLVLFIRRQLLICSWPPAVSPSSFIPSPTFWKFWFLGLWSFVSFFFLLLSSISPFLSPDCPEYQFKMGIRQVTEFWLSHWLSIWIKLLAISELQVAPWHTGNLPGISCNPEWACPSFMSGKKRKIEFGVKLMESNPETPSAQCDPCRTLQLFIEEWCHQHRVTVEITLIISV